MKFTLIAAISIFSTLASGLAILDLTRRGRVIRPATAIVVKEDLPNTPLPPTKIVGVSRVDGAHTVRTRLGFVVPACTGKCTISFSDAMSATGSRRLQLFATSRPLTAWDTWNTGIYRDLHKGTFLVSSTGAGPATVVEDFGLTFPCPSTTTNRGFEVKAVGNNDYVIWDITKGGFIITCG